jgi:hypothetical protein
MTVLLQMEYNDKIEYQLKIENEKEYKSLITQYYQRDKLFKR